MKGRAWAALALTTVMSCGGVPADAGLAAWLRVEGASFREGPLPTAAGGPEVVAIDLGTSRVEAGQVGKPLRGSVAEGATGVALALESDLGHWLLPAGLPDVAVPDYPTFDVALSFGARLPEGPRTLHVAASDAAGRFGPPRDVGLDVVPRGVPDGPLVVSLSWDRDADLDLHVGLPNGVEISKSNGNAYEPPAPGEPVDPTAWQAGARLDVDSNANCSADGRRLENVVWTAEPTKGRYVVRVDTFSLCGLGFANWEVTVRLRGARIAHATGSSGPTEEAMPHDRGAGVVAVDFDVP